MFPSQLTPDGNDEGGTPKSEMQDHKEKGKKFFQNGNHAAALESFQAALHASSVIGADSIPSSERAILLSNIVACRLKIGGSSMAAAAVEESKECIRLNDQWAKAYVRLASSYIALEGHSNDACNALQHALKLDPSYSEARKMLVQQLRRENTKEYSNNGVNPSAPSSEHAASTSSQSQQSGTEDPLYNDVIDDDSDLYGSTRPGASNSQSIGGSGFLNRVKEHLNQLKEQFFRTVPLSRLRFDNLSEEMQSLLKVVAVLLVLYVAFGGRFGLGQVLGSGRSVGTDYRSGNAYDRFRQEHGYDAGSPSWRDNPHYQAQHDPASQHRSNRRHHDLNESARSQYHTSRYDSRDNDSYHSGLYSSRRTSSYDSHRNGRWYDSQYNGHGFDRSTSYFIFMILAFVLNRYGGDRFGGLGLMGPMAMRMGRFGGRRFRFGYGGGFAPGIWMGGGFGGRRGRWR